mmetsp:Transcript_21356/g.66184  ORF Transcript_21356/g.66184 Transcript_21356/m.66184 type:complete len:224 (+) Transcript_21356:1487-2158(+)
MTCRVLPRSSRRCCADALPPACSSQSSTAPALRPRMATWPSPDSSSCRWPSRGETSRDSWSASLRSASRPASAEAVRGRWFPKRSCAETTASSLECVGQVRPPLAASGLWPTRRRKLCTGPDEKWICEVWRSTSAPGSGLSIRTSASTTSAISFSMSSSSSECCHARGEVACDSRARPLRPRSTRSAPQAEGRACRPCASNAKTRVRKGVPATASFELSRKTQ